MMQRVLILLLMILAVAACRKEPLPEPTSQSPVFYMRAMVQGVSVNLEAGSDGYIMVPGFYQDSNNVYVLTSELRNPDCGNCYGLTIKLNDHMVSSLNGPLHIDSALRNGQYIFSDKTLEPAQYEMELRPEDDEDPTGQYSWTVSCADQEDKVFNSYQAYFQADALKSYTVVLSYQDATGCSRTLERYFVPGQGQAADITAVKTGASDLSYAFSCPVQGEQPISYHWDFGDGHTSAQSSPAHTYTQGAAPFYLVTLTVTWPDYKITKAHYQVAATTDPVCLANFAAEVTGIPNLMALSKITIELTDPGGKVYSSNDFVQPAGSRFEVTSVEEYEVSDLGYRTRRFKALFNCQLRSGGQEISVTNGEAVLGVSYP